MERINKILTATCALNEDDMERLRYRVIILEEKQRRMDLKSPLAGLALKLIGEELSLIRERLERDQRDRAKQRFKLIKGGLGLLAMCLGLSLASPAQAVDIESKEMVHFAAHVGASYAVTHGVYAICKAVSDKKLPCLLAGVGASVGAGVLKEALDRRNGASLSNNARSMGQNAIGIGIAATLISVSW